MLLTCRAATAAVALLVPMRLRASDEAGARVLFFEARKLAAAGDYAAACPKFEDSFRLDPGIGTNFNLADCYEHTGRIASAWARFLDVAAATKAAGQVERERVARARAAALEPKLARLTIAVEATAPGLSVVRDGIDVGAAAWRVAVPVDPGPHVIEASAPGRSAWKTTADVPVGPSAITVVVPELAEAPQAPAVAPAVSTFPATAPPSALGEVGAGAQLSRRGWSRPVLIVGAIGAGALIAGTAFGIKFEMDNGEAQATCPASTNCTTAEVSSHASLVNSARTDLKIEVGGLVLGGASLLAAGFLWWRDARHDRTSPAPSAAVAALPFGPVGLALGGEW